jgi:hypothetical protein
MRESASTFTFICLSWALLCAGGCQSGPEPAGGDAPRETKKDESEESDQQVETVDFEFGWEAPSTRTAEATRAIRKIGGEETTYRGSYKLGVESTEAGLRVAVEPDFGGGAAGSEPQLSEIVTAASFVAMPTMAVGPDGSFDGVADIEATRRQFREAAASAADTGQGLPKEIGSMLDKLLSREVLEVRARQFWELLVGLWAGETMEVGETYSSETEASFELPVVGTREMQMSVEFGVRERVACNDSATPDDDGPGCVRTAVTSRPDVREMETLMQKWVDKMAELQATRTGRSEVPDLQVADVFVRSNITLVTRPADLRPMVFREKRTTRMTLQAPNGREKSYRYVDEREMTFR